MTDYIIVVVLEDSAVLDDSFRKLDGRILVCKAQTPENSPDHVKKNASEYLISNLISQSILQ